MKFTVRRTYMVRKVETFEVELPDSEDAQHIIDNHFADFDRDLTYGAVGTLTSEGYEHLDYDERHLEVLDRANAKVIQMRKKS